ncbi:MAG: SWIM zinc finger family protein [Sulfolobus sp.]
MINSERKMVSQNPLIKNVYITYSIGLGVIVSADIQSKSRPNLTHYARVILNPLTLEVTRETCDCEAFTYRRKCWHIKALEEAIKNELRGRIEVTAKEMLAVEEDIASWG